MFNFIKRWAFNVVQKEIGNWGDKTFPESTPQSVYNHLCREIKELGDEHANVYMESADVALLLIHIAHKRKFSLYDALMTKFSINKRRKWGKPDAQGVVEHLK